MNGDLNSSEQKFQALVAESVDLIETTLRNSELSLLERANVALKVLAMASIEQKSELRFNSSPMSQSLGSTPAIESTQILENHWVVSPQFVQINDFLSPEEYQTALEIAFSHQSEFFEAGIFNKAVNYRQSFVLLFKNLPDFYELMRLKILETRPHVLEQLGLTSFLVSFVEMQMTVYQDGGFYKIHSDIDPEKAPTRTLSYVYYFYQEPKSFYGGELRLYETQFSGEEPKIQENFEMIQPRNNTIVFFDSRCKHEILPISCPSGRFEHSRFTINGWVCR
ncbi:MAG: 2OG-Fe(II) oxygenase [Microcoleaceae cyanobacterium]